MAASICSLQGKKRRRISFDQNKVEEEAAERSVHSVTITRCPDPTNEPASRRTLSFISRGRRRFSRLYTSQLIYRATFIPRECASRPFIRQLKPLGVGEGGLVARASFHSSYNGVTTSSHPPAGNRALLKRHAAAGTMNDTEKAEWDIYSPLCTSSILLDGNAGTTTSAGEQDQKDVAQEGEGEGGRKIVT